MREKEHHGFAESRRFFRSVFFGINIQNFGGPLEKLSVENDALKDARADPFW